jgi:hypothetical protein
MKDYPVKEFTCVQKDDYSVQLQIVPRNSFSNEHKGQILETMRVNLPGIDVQVVVVDEIPKTAANKWQIIISEIKSDRTS